MEYKEILSKTSLKIVGICKGVNKYVGKTKEYYSVDLEVKGTKMPVNVKLGDDFKRETLKDYELVVLDVVVMPAFDKRYFELHAA